jgi:enoyl-CoA hydratase/carnithine racemase
MTSAPARTDDDGHTSEPILVVDAPVPGIRRLTLNRPASLNALSRDLVGRLVEELRRAEEDLDVRVLVIAAAGKAFSAGADFEEHFQQDGFDVGRTDLWERLEAVRVPVIAAVQGWAVTGGFLLAYCCDIVVAAEDAKFRDTHAALGLVPTGGESQRMPRRLGPFVARDLMFTSRVMEAQEAHRIGFVSRVVPVDELGTATLEIAEKVAVNSPRSVTTIKQLINLGSQADLGIGRRLELMHNAFGAANNDDDPDRVERIKRIRGRS